MSKPKSITPSAEECVRCCKPTPTVTQFGGTPETGFGMRSVCSVCATPRPQQVEPADEDADEGVAAVATETPLLRASRLDQPAKVHKLPASQRSAHDLIDEARARLKTVDAELARFDALRAERALLERILEVAT